MSSRTEANQSTRIECTRHRLTHYSACTAPGSQHTTRLILRRHSIMPDSKYTQLALRPHEQQTRLSEACVSNRLRIAVPSVLLSRLPCPKWHAVIVPRAVLRAGKSICLTSTLSTHYAMCTSQPGACMQDMMSTVQSN